MEQLSKDSDVKFRGSDDDSNSDTDIIIPTPDEKPENSKVKEKEIEAKNGMFSFFNKPQRIPPEPPPNQSISHKDNQQPDGRIGAEDEDIETPFEESKYPTLNLTSELVEKGKVGKLDK